VRNTLDGWFSEDLPDMNQEEPEVARYEIQNALWWIGVSGIDGIRQGHNSIHAAQFHSRSFQCVASAVSQDVDGGRSFERDAAQTAFFIGGPNELGCIDTKLDSDFDFSLWQVALDVFTGKKADARVARSAKIRCVVSGPAEDYHPDE